MESGVLGPLESVYLGGGTPSLMRPRRIARLLEALEPHLAPGAEISIEANPETVEARALRDLRLAGVNRLSLGVQSFQPHLLRGAGATGDARPGPPRRRLRPARRLRGPQHRPALRRPGPDPGRPRGRPGRGPRARAGPRLLVRARAEARLAPGVQRHRAVRRGRGGRRLPAGGGGPRGRRLPLVRDRQLRPAGPPLPAQPGLLGRGRLPRHRGRGGVHRRRARAGATRPAWGATSRLSRPARSRRARASRSTPTRCGASAGCSACGWTSRSTWPGPGRRTSPRPSTRLRRLGLVAEGDDFALTREGRFLQNAVLHELMEYV